MPNQSHRDHLLNDAPSEAVAAVNAMLVATVAQHDPEYAKALAHVPEDDEPVTCVYSIHEIAWEWLGLEEIDFYYEDAKLKHESECAICRGEVDGDCDYFDYYEDGPGGRAHADAEWVRGDDGMWDAPGAGIMLIENESTVQCVLSPETWRRGWCSPCYAGQTDSGADGDILCYKIPDVYLREDWRLMPRFLTYHDLDCEWCLEHAVHSKSREERMRFLRWAMGWAELALGLPLSPENEGDG